MSLFSWNFALWNYDIYFALWNYDIYLDAKIPDAIFWDAIVKKIYWAIK